MSESKFEILTSTESVVKRLEDYLKEEITSIKIYCKNFGLYTQDSFKNPHFKTRFHNTSLSSQMFSAIETYIQDNPNKPEGFVEIHTFQALTETNILGKINHKQKVKDVFFLSDDNKLVKVIASSECLELFVSFLQKLIEQIPNDKKPKTFKTISEVVQLFFKYTDKQEESLKDALEFLKEKLIKRVNELKNNEGFEFNIQEEINRSFENIEAKIQKIKKDKKRSLWKATLVFFVEILPSFFNNLTLSSFQDITESMQRFYDTSTEVFRDQYKYTYLIPLFQTLAMDIAPALTLLVKTTLKEEIQLESKNAFYFLDYSNFDTSSQNHSLYIHLSYAIARELEKTPSEPEEYAICLIKEAKDISSDFELFSKIDNRRISVFFSPYFNSYKLTNWIKEKEKENAQKSQTQEGKNYLIFSQCPKKSNAGLNEGLIEKLGYEIKDDINRNPQAPKLAQKPKNTHNPAVDYSKYEIKINAKDNQPFVLSLSPFVFISKENVPEYKESFWSFILKSNDEKQKSALYIESFFRQEGELEDFLKKEEEQYLQVIDRLRNFVHTLCKQNLYIQPQYLEPLIVEYQTCTILEVLSLILLLKTISENYNNVNLNERSLKINNDEIVFFVKETFFIPNEKYIKQGLFKTKEHPHTLQQNGELIPICVSSSDSASLSLEYFVNQLNKDKEIQKQELYEKLYSLVFDEKNNEKDSIQLEYGELFLGFIQVFIEAFPFSFVSEDSQSLALKFLNALLSSTYAKEMIKQLDTMLKIKELCLASSKDQIRLYQLLSFQAQKYEDIPLNREFDRQEALLNALDAVAKEIPSAFADIIKSGKFLNPKIAFVDFFSSLLKTFIYSTFLSRVKSINTEFNNQKREYQTLIYFKFTDKNNAPLALKREEGVYYPLAINQTSFNFSFSNYILGGRLCSGGMGELDANFYIFDTLGAMTTPKRNALEKLKNLYLNILFMLLCLDELRNGRIGERVEDEKFFKQDHSSKDFANYMLDIEKQSHKALYKSYDGGSGEDDGSNQAGGIDSYQVVMQYFGDIRRGVFDSDISENTPNPERHREAIRALDNIGKNNIRGLYVGIREENKRGEKQQKQKRPKLIGRLATTIIMKDGLRIG